jgi:hypothetical protein
MLVDKSLEIFKDRGQFAVESYDLGSKSNQEHDRDRHQGPAKPLNHHFALLFVLKHTIPDAEIVEGFGCDVNPHKDDDAN